MVHIAANHCVLLVHLPQSPTASGSSPQIPNTTSLEGGTPLPGPTSVPSPVSGTPLPGPMSVPGPASGTPLPGPAYACFTTIEPIQIPSDSEDDLPPISFAEQVGILVYAYNYDHVHI